MVGKGRAEDCNALRTCATDSAGCCDTIRATTPATKGEEKLVPTVMSKLLVQLELTGPWLPVLVAERIG